MSEPTNPAALALVPTNSANSAAALFMASGTVAYCSLDPKDKRYEEALYKFDEEADAQLSEAVNLQLLVEHVYAKPISLIDPNTGDTRNALRTCVMEPDGTVYSCAADGVRDSIARLIAIHGLPPWTGGVKVKVKMRKLKNGKQRLLLIPAGQAGEGDDEK